MSKALDETISGESVSLFPLPFLFLIPLLLVFYFLFFFLSASPSSSFLLRLSDPWQPEHSQIGWYAERMDQIRVKTGRSQYELSDLDSDWPILRNDHGCSGTTGTGRVMK